MPLGPEGRGQPASSASPRGGCKAAGGEKGQVRIERESRWAARGQWQDALVELGEEADLLRRGSALAGRGRRAGRGRDGRCRAGCTSGHSRKEEERVALRGFFGGDG